MNGKRKVVKKVTKDPRMVLIGARLASLRKAAGHTSAEKFAYEHDISRSQYSSYEKGSDMRISSLLKMLDIHGISLKDFFSEGFE